MKSSRTSVRTVLSTALVLAMLWLLLAGPDPTGWLVGLPAIVLAIGCLVALPGAARADFRLPALARLVGAFLRDSLRGAIDVGLRCLTRNPIGRTRIVRWRTGLRSPAARLVLVHAISLVPGTLTARVRGDTLDVHVLDSLTPYRTELAALEARICAALEPATEPAR